MRPPDAERRPGRGSGDHDGGQHVTDSIPAQLRRRREAARRLPAYDDDGHRDPLELLAEAVPLADLTPIGLAAWRRALTHLDALGLPGLPPAHIVEALRRQRVA